LPKSAFLCVLPFCPLASSVTANALLISHSVPFLPFYSFIPEIFGNFGRFYENGVTFVTQIGE
ncbi:hypothetical protein AALD19_17000, partial [Bacteroides acidifaciens]|uniref:hypothetical protein n=1 Tax=Bacteroides acidifaciens TaxID=85831 RepID=UPI003514B247